MADSLASLRVLILGDLFSPEMQTVERRIEGLARDGCDVRVQRSLADAVTKCSADAWQPDLLIVCQHWPDEYSAAEVRKLLTVFALARLVSCYGRWCASDGRTRDVWPLSTRVPAEFASRRIDLELEVISGTRSPLPLTASRDEIFLFDPEMGIDRILTPLSPCGRGVGGEGTSSAPST
jgi:hypothetical protein